MEKMKVGGTAAALGLLCLMGLALSPLAAADSQSASPAGVQEGPSQGDTAVQNWVDIANATGAPDGAIATHVMEDSGGWGNMHAISFDDFGFSIPASAVIDGIELVVGWDVITPAVGTGTNVFGISVDAANSYTSDSTYRVIAGTTICNTDGYNTIAFTDKAALAAVCAPVALSGHEWIFMGWPHDGSGLVSPYLTRGSPTDMWGANEVDGNGITPAEINTAAFGVVHMARAGSFGDTFAMDGMTMTIFYTVPPPTFTRSGAADSAFSTPFTGQWAVEFGESVSNVTDDDFTLTLSGDAAVATGPTVTGSGTSYTVDISGVSGAAGSVELNFVVNDVVLTADGTTPATAASSGTQSYANVVAAPAANHWVLIFMGVMLALAAAVVIRKKAFNH